MSVVKEFTEENTTIRIHNDYINTDEQNKTNEIIISLMINTLKNKNNWLKILLIYAKIKACW